MHLPSLNTRNSPKIISYRRRQKKCHECFFVKPCHLVFQTSAVLLQHKIETCCNSTKCALKFSLSNVKFNKVTNCIDFFSEIRQSSDVLKFDKREVVELIVVFLMEIYTTAHSGNEENIVDQSCTLRHPGQNIRKMFLQSKCLITQAESLQAGMYNLNVFAYPMPRHGIIEAPFGKNRQSFPGHL
jgi:hypothetical protein